MKQIILIHTVQTMYLTFESRVREFLSEEVKIDNILDTYVTSNPNEIGYFSNDNLNRLFLLIKAAELAKPDLIAVVCSSMSPHVRYLANMFSVPVLRIDTRLGAEAIKKGKRIAVLASANSAVDPTSSLILEAAAEAGVEVDIEAKVDPRALQAMMSGDMDMHRKYMLELAGTISDKDVIVFAQGSTEYLTEDVEKMTGIPVVTAPQLLLEDIKATLEG